MAGEPDGIAGAPAAQAGQPQAGTTPDPKPSVSVPAPQTPPTDEEGDDEAQAAERLSLDEAKKLRSEARSLRQRLHLAEQKVKEADDAKLSEQERLQKKVQELEATQQEMVRERRDLLIRQAVERTARRLNLVDEEAAYVLLDKSDLDGAQDDLQDKVDAGLKALVKAKPWMQAKEQPAAIPATPRADDGRGATAAQQEQARLELQRRVKRMVA